MNEWQRTAAFVSLNGRGVASSSSPILPPQNGYLFLDKTKFRASFAADVSEAKAAFLGGLRCRGALVCSPA
jgi:flagellar capping protein FliD